MPRTPKTAERHRDAAGWQQQELIAEAGGRDLELALRWAKMRVA